LIDRKHGIVYTAVDKAIFLKNFPGEEGANEDNLQLISFYEIEAKTLIACLLEILSADHNRSQTFDKRVVSNNFQGPDSFRAGKIRSFQLRG